MNPVCHGILFIVRGTAEAALFGMLSSTKQHIERQEVMLAATAVPLMCSHLWNAGNLRQERRHWWRHLVTLSETKLSWNRYYCNDSYDLLI